MVCQQKNFKYTVSTMCVQQHGRLLANVYIGVQAVGKDTAPVTGRLEAKTGANENGVPASALTRRAGEAACRPCQSPWFVVK